MAASATALPDAPAAGPIPDSGPRRLALGGALALAAAMGVGRFVYTPILPAMAEGLGLTGAQAGLIATANVVGYLVGALAAATPRLPGSRRAWLLGSLAASVVTTGLMAGASSVPALAALRFLGGAASAFALVFASALVLDRLAQAGRTGLSALHFAGVGLGIALSAVLVSAAADAGLGWRGQWIAAGGLALLALPAVALLVPPEPAGARAAAGEGRRLAVGLPFGLLLGAYFLFGLGYIVAATFLMTMVRAEPALAAVEPAVWLVVGLPPFPRSRPGTRSRGASACCPPSVSRSSSRRPGSPRWRPPSGLPASSPARRCWASPSWASRRWGSPAPGCSRPTRPGRLWRS